MHLRLPAVLLLVAAAPALAQAASDFPDRPIARGEVVAVVRKQFALIDANHDGIVTRAEFDAFRARQAAGKVDAGALGPFGHVGGHWFEHADAKGDGRVTLAEAEARPLQMFDTVDVNHDGVIGPNERQMATMLLSLGGK